MARISVIIPTHNRSDYLRLGINSVLTQTFQDFEIIVVDDASKDRSYEVVMNFKDKRIKYIRHNTNMGPSAARNTGIVESTSDLIAFLDDDDEWMPEKLKKQIDILDNSSPLIGGVFTGCIVIDRNSGRILGQRIHTQKGNIFNELLEYNLIGALPTVLVRKECFKKVGVFDENMPFAEDWDMWIRISKKFHFECIREILVKCYVHGRDKLSFNLEALNKGLDIMVNKYGQYPSLRKICSVHYLSLGVRYCYNGNTPKGRESFLKAIKLYPFEIRHYFNLFLSLFGADNFKKLKEIKKIIFGPSRGRSSWKDHNKC